MDCVGEGGFGAVYLCHDHNMERDVAIKVFQPRDENSENGMQGLRQRFVQEAQILGKLSDSRYIVNVYEFGERKRVPLIM